MVMSPVYTRTIFKGVNKAGDVVRGYGNDEGVGDDCQYTDTFENPMPDTCQPTQRKTFSVLSIQGKKRQS